MKPGDSVPISLEFEVAVNALAYDLSICSGEMIQGFTGPEEFLETNASDIQSLAAQLSQNTGTICDIEQNIYTNVIDRMEYGGYVAYNAGALSALNKGSGDCTDYADLTIALSRAAGIPARFLEGITYSKDGFYEEAQTKHDWLEVYLPGAGWVPMDPTWGEGQPAQYYASMTPDHIIITKGRNLETLNNYFYWAYWWWGDTNKVKVQVYDESWRIWKK
jgi:transglutaminase-like putative cysteine protease